MGVPNGLTMLRVLLIPVMVVFFVLPVGWGEPAAAVVFVLAALTDWFDGFLARRLEQGSRFGAFLDPVADKLLVTTALVLLVMANGHFWVALPALFIIGREIAVSALREWMAQIGASRAVAVSRIGKVKTAVQMVAIVCMLYAHPIGGVPIYLIGLALLYLAAALTLFSMYMYLEAARPELGRRRTSRKNSEL
ncbi:MAG: CDP-diacylglycerol--glycerol-3-phosphate 3-phosphatidyltransferase [Gammaproteobacteria bacterium]|nr:CDP-diacylglycerol--glycerol-3-phosphate 3-phosphatidyltransferase [Gammaproteobacteria bacterium]